MTKRDNENFKNSTEYWVCDNDYIENDVKVRDHCHITGKHSGPAHRSQNHKIPVIFYRLKSYDSHLLMQELAKFNLKISVIPNGLEKYMSFNINNKLSFIDSFQFLSSSLNNLVKNLSKDDFKYLSQNFDGKELDVVTQESDVVTQELDVVTQELDVVTQKMILSS